MGKLAAFLLGFLMLQTVSAEVTNSADEQEKLRDLVKQIWSISDDVVDTIQNTTNTNFNTESRELGFHIEEIIKRLEEVKNNINEKTETIENVYKNVDQVLSVLTQLKNNTNATTTIEFKTLLALRIKNAASQLKLLVESIPDRNLKSESDHAQKIFSTEHLPATLLVIFTKYVEGIQAFQSKIAEATVTDSAIGYSSQELVRKIQKSSEELYQKIINIESKPLIREYVRDLTAVTARLEKIGKTSCNFKPIIKKFRDVLIFLSKFANREPVSLETLRLLLENISMMFETLLKDTSEHVSDLKNVALLYISITKRFHYVDLGSTSPRYGRSDYFKNGKISTNIIRDLSESLKRITRDENTVKQNLINIVCEYLENLSEISLFHFEQKSRALLKFFRNGPHVPLDDIKIRIYKFVSEINNEMEKMSENTKYKFWRQTHKLQVHVANVDNESANKDHIHHLSFRMRCFEDLLSSMLQTITTDSKIVEQDILVQRREFINALEKILVKVENTEAPREIVSNTRKFIENVRNDLDVYKFVTVIQVATTELQKLLVISSNSKHNLQGPVYEFLNMLQWQWHAMLDIFGKTQDVEHLTMHIEATTNKLGVYFHSEKPTDEIKDLYEMVKQIIDKLESGSPSTELTTVLDCLRNIVEQFDTSRYEVNDFLEKVALHFKKLAWTVSERKDDVHNYIKDSLMNYWIKLQKVYVVEKVHNGIHMIRTRPVEAVRKIEIATNSLSKLLRLVTRDHKHSKLVYQGRHFVELLEIALFRLRQWSNGAKKNNTLEEVRKNLAQIQEDTEHAISSPDVSLKIRLGIYILDAIMEIKKLAHDPSIREDNEVQKLFGNFWFGIKHIQSQMQYNLQVVTEESSLETLTMQVQFVTHDLSILLQRSQLKPELSSIIFTQIEVFTHEIGYLLDFVQDIPGDKQFQEMTTKLSKIYQTLKEVTKKRFGKSVVELTAFLDTYAQTVVMDLEDIAFSEHLQTSQFVKVYKRFLAGMSNIMVRLQNVHYYEYYSWVEPIQLVEKIQKLTTAVVSRLENTFFENHDTKSDLIIQILKYTHRLRKVVEHFEDHAEPRSLLDIISKLLQLLLNSSEVPVNELKAKLVLHVKSAATNIEKWNNGDHQTVKNVLIAYLVAIEKLFIHAQHIWVRSQHEQTIRQTVLHVETHVRYFSKVLEHIEPNNTDAIIILQSQYRGLNETVSKILTKLRDTSASSTKIQQVIKTLSEFHFDETSDYRSVDDFKINTDLQIQRINWALWELVWFKSDTKPPGLEQVVKACLNDLSRTVQNMHIEIDSKVVIPQITQWLSERNLKMPKDHGSSVAQEKNKHSDSWTGHLNSNRIVREGTKPQHPGRIRQLPKEHIQPVDESQRLEEKSGTQYVPKSDSEKYQTKSPFGDEYQSIIGFPSFWYSATTPKQSNGRIRRLPEEPIQPVDETQRSEKRWDIGYVFKNSEKYKTKSIFGNSHQSTIDFPSYWSSATTTKRPKCIEGHKALVAEIKNIVRYASDYLRKNEVQQDLYVYVRELVQILDNVVEYLKGKETRNFSVQLIVKQLMNISNELKDVIQSQEMHKLKYQFADAIERVALEIERVASLERGIRIEVSENVFVQLLNFLRKFKNQTTLAGSAHYQSKGLAPKALTTSEWF